jgi:hypothetical protein
MTFLTPAVRWRSRTRARPSAPTMRASRPHSAAPPDRRNYGANYGANYGQSAVIPAAIEEVRRGW